MKNSFLLKIVAASLVPLALTACATQVQVHKAPDGYQSLTLIKGHHHSIIPAVYSKNNKTFISLPPKVIIKHILVNSRQVKFIKVGEYWIAEGSGRFVSLDTNIGGFDLENLSATVKGQNYYQKKPNKESDAKSISVPSMVYKIDFPENSAAIDVAQSNQLATIPSGNLAVFSCVPKNNYNLYVDRGMSVTAWLYNHDQHSKVIFNGLNKNCNSSSVGVYLESK